MARDVSSVRLSRLNRLMMLFYQYARRISRVIFPGIDGHRFRSDNEINLTGGARDGKEKRKQQIL